jgi:hypothetical protein
MVFQDDGTIVLARYPARRGHGEVVGAHDLFGFERPTGAVVQAFQANPLMLVATDPTPFGTTVPKLSGDARFRNRLDIGDWRFRLNIGRGSTATDFRNVLIVKTYSGTLRNRLADSGQWTGAISFNRAPDRIAALGVWLQAYCDAATTRGKDPLYAYFVDTVLDNPGWTGFVALNVTLDATETLPDEVRRYGADFAAQGLTAHHFGASVSRVNTPGEQPGPGLASTFGLIDDAVPTPASGATTWLNYQKGRLGPQQSGTAVVVKALFENSALTSFSMGLREEDDGG